LNKPSDSTGYVLACRRGKNAPDKTVVRFRGLSPEKNYKLTDDDTNAVITKSGKELMEGFEITFDKAPGSRMLMYSAE
jgi:alpha-galactosidase